MLKEFLHWLPNASVRLRMIAVPLSSLRGALLMALIAYVSLTVMTLNTSRSCRAQTTATENTQHSEIGQQFNDTIRPILQRYCVDCHSGPDAQGEIDLAALHTFDQARRRVRMWQRVRDMLDTAQMPPPEAKQPPQEQRMLVRDWVHALLRQEGLSRASDPGPMLLRRLNNAEYTYTLRDLTGVETLNPAEEFPADGAAGEGFSNTGLALAMSPPLVEKYLDSAKKVAAHAVLMPEGIRFSASTSRRDWSNELVAEIRQFYARYTENGGGIHVNLQGIQFTTNQGGRLPVERYLAALFEARGALRNGTTSIEQVAQARGLNSRYLMTLWNILNGRLQGGILLQTLQDAWKQAEEDPGTVTDLAEQIASWQRAVWKQNPVGHIVRHLGGTTGPAAWLEPVLPLREEQTIEVPLKASGSDKELVIYLAAFDVSERPNHPYVLWQRPRIRVPNHQEILLRDVPRVTAELVHYRHLLATTTAACLAALSEIKTAPDETALTALARRYDVPPEALRAWCISVGLLGNAPLPGTYFTSRSEQVEGYTFVQGWVADNALSVLANASDQHVRIPGSMKPYSVAVHPAPDRRVVVAWKSPIDAEVHVEAQIQHAHPECGNGTAWSVEVRRGFLRRVLGSGTTQREQVLRDGPHRVAVRRGDYIALVIAPRDGNHYCDLTATELTITTNAQRWTLSDDVAPNILAGNPHPDKTGRPDVWHFLSEPDKPSADALLPAGSLLDLYLQESDTQARRDLAARLETLFREGPDRREIATPDRQLYQLWMSFHGPWMTAMRQGDHATPYTVVVSNHFGIAPSDFGKHPTLAEDQTVDEADLCVVAPYRAAIRLPAELVDGGQFLATVRIHKSSQPEAAVQVHASVDPPADRPLSGPLSVVAQAHSPGWQKWQRAVEQFCQYFPPALCYTQIVPVDEVITLNLYYREDHHLKRLMLTEAEAAELDRLWEALEFVSQEPIQLAAAYEQLIEYATQDRPDKVAELTPLRAAVEARVEEFRRRQQRAEPVHRDWVIRWAARAYRRPLRQEEVERLQTYYQQLREQQVDHEDAIRFLIARILTSPAFLYRVEESKPDVVSHRVSDFELASRLSYFLWASLPDEDLWQTAVRGELHRPEVLRVQVARMLADEKIRRLAIEFAAHWLQVYEFDERAEKSETYFPEFSHLRPLMYEEFIQFFTYLFQADRPMLEILDADYTFLNESLAAFYGVADVHGEKWRKVDGVRRWHRGGILSQAALLASQSGASRTSPILRGAWISEVLLGEKLPRPPPNVPQLANAAPEGLTERQLIERHSREPACARCHARIDPLGFALENYDAIGRFRERDAQGLPVDARTTLHDGTVLEGPEALRNYLLVTRRQDFVRQFNKKLLGYALGRAIQLSDEPLIEEMEKTLQQQNYRIGAAIETIVLSRQFREIRGGAFRDPDEE